MKLYLVSLAVLVLQAVGAPALARDIADNIAWLEETDSQQNTPVIAAKKPKKISKSEWRAATRIWGFEVLKRASTLYARGPLREGLSGLSQVKFEVGPDGVPRECHALASSGSDSLDDIACQAVSQASPAPILLDDNGEAQSIWAVLPVRFVDGDKLELEEGAP